MAGRFSFLPVVAGLTVLVMSLALAVLTVTGRAGSGNQNLQSKAALNGGALKLAPASAEYVYTAGQTIPVGLIVSSAEKSVDGVDVIINFDPTKAEIVGDSLTATTLFERYPLNQVNNTTGQIRFSALTFNPRPVSGIVATFSFRPKAPGSIEFSFDFVPRATTDSNIAEHGTALDILEDVENATFLFK